jgi:hypothetical protein
MKNKNRRDALLLFPEINTFYSKIKDPEETPLPTRSETRQEKMDRKVTKTNHSNF